MDSQEEEQQRIKREEGRENNYEERQRRERDIAWREGRDGVERRNEEDLEWLSKNEELLQLREENGRLIKELDAIKERIKIPKVSVMSIIDQAHKLDDKKKTEGSHAFVLYDNGLLTSQKGGDLLWERSEFWCTPKVSRTSIVSFATPTEPKKRYIYVTKEEGMMLHNQLRILYGIPEDLKCGDVQRMLGCSLDQLYRLSLLPENAGIPTDQITIPCGF